METWKGCEATLLIQKRRAKRLPQRNQPAVETLPWWLKAILEPSERPALKISQDTKKTPEQTLHFPSFSLIWPHLAAPDQ